MWSLIVCRFERYVSVKDWGWGRTQKDVTKDETRAAGGAAKPKQTGSSSGSRDREGVQPAADYTFLCYEFVMSIRAAFRQLAGDVWDWLRGGTQTWSEASVIH